MKRWIYGVEAEHASAVLQHVITFICSGSQCEELGNTQCVFLLCKYSLTAYGSCTILKSSFKFTRRG